jgi:uncharacterized protein (TIGR03435 family)
MESEHFDIAAKYPPGTAADDRPVMLRTLLEDRFKLVVHRETKDLPGYALVVSKHGFKLQPVEPGYGADTSSNGGRIRTLTAQRTSMALLADLLSRQLGEMVVDKTGIAGAYNFEMKWTTDDQPSAASDAQTVPTLFTALEEKLGLRLQPQKVPVEIIVVDHVERTPAEN